MKTPKLSNVRVTGYEGVISIKNIGEPSDVYVYSTGGKLIENVTSAYGSINISVPSEQLYVIKVGSQTYKLGM